MSNQRGVSDNKHRTGNFKCNNPCGSRMKLFKTSPEPGSSRDGEMAAYRPPPKPAGLDGRSLPRFILSPRDS